MIFSVQVVEFSFEFDEHNIVCMLVIDIRDEFCFFNMVSVAKNVCDKVTFHCSHDHHHQGKSRPNQYSYHWIPEI